MISVLKFLRSDRIRRLSMEGFWVVTGQMLTVIGSLALIRVLTEYLVPSQYGQLTLALTVAGLANSVVMAGVIAGVGRFYSIAVERVDLYGYLRASARLFGYATLVMIGVGLVLLVGLSWLGQSHWIGIVFTVLVFSVLNSFNSSLSGIQNAARQRAVVAFHGGFDAWLKILLVVGAMLWLGVSGMAVVIGYVCSSLIVTCSQLIFLRKLIPFHGFKSAGNHVQWVRQIWDYSWPFATWGIFGWMQLSSGYWALISFSTKADVGMYAVLTQLGYVPVILIASLAMSFLTPILFSRAGDASCSTRNKNVQRIVIKLTFFGIGVVGIAVIMAIFLHPYIFHLFVSENYASISYYMPWLVLSGGIFAIAQLLATLQMANKKSYALIPASIGSSLVGIVASFSGVYFFSLAGAVMASIIHSISYLIFVTIIPRGQR